jgi:hypothetical protein
LILLSAAALLSALTGLRLLLAWLLLTWVLAGLLVALLAALLAGLVLVLIHTFSSCCLFSSHEDNCSREFTFLK